MSFWFLYFWGCMHTDIFEEKHTDRFPVCCISVNSHVFFYISSISRTLSCSFWSVSWCWIKAVSKWLKFTTIVWFERFQVGKYSISFFLNIQISSHAYVLPTLECPRYMSNCGRSVSVLHLLTWNIILKVTIFPKIHNFSPTSHCFWLDNSESVKKLKIFTNLIDCFL